MKFKPTLVLEMDMMKTLLDDFEKLEQLILEIEIADAFWLNQQNKSLYLILKKEYHKCRNKKDFSIENYYKIVFNKAFKTIPNFDIKVYEDFYEIDFKFYSTFLNYYQYFKCKRVLTLIDELKNQFEKSELEADSIFAKIEQIKREYGTMLKREI
jgi:hypothetical protein